MLLDSQARLLRDLAWTMVTPAKQHDANTLYLLQTVPALASASVSCSCMTCMTWPAARGGKISCPLAAWSKREESAGKRYGTPGTQIGQALKGACSEAAVLFLRNHPRAKSIWPVERKTARARP